MSAGSKSDLAEGPLTAAEVLALKRRARRERATRLEAERIGEETTRRLYLANQQLEEALATAERSKGLAVERAAELAQSNEALEQFAYIASHDLREPLRMVSSYTALLAKRYQGQIDAKADRYIGYVVEGAQRMSSMIDDLLRVSEVSGEGHTFQRVDVGTAVQEAIDNLQMLIRESEGKVFVDDLPTVSGDAGQLVQLFQNLIANAIKFRGDDPPRVHVSADRDDDDWVFSVRDNGIGLNPEYAGRIFKMFQRVHKRGKYEGSGIGLAIVKRIVNRHRGRVWVESEIGKGADFLFTVPQVREP